MSTKKPVLVGRSQEKPQGLSQVHWFTLAPMAVAQSRFATCLTCPQLNSAKFCRVCWCYMPAKTKLAAFACPEDKWAAVPNYREA